MALRRPRIKAIANIGVKRKIKEEPTEPIVKNEVISQKLNDTNTLTLTEELKKNVVKCKDEPLGLDEAIIKNDITEKNENINNSQNETIQKAEIILPLDCTTKCPQSENLQSQNPPFQPVKKPTDMIKPRQRIKATPVIESMRRNSVNCVNYQSDNEISNADHHDSPFKDPPAKMKIYNSNRYSDNRLNFGSSLFLANLSSGKHPPPSPHPRDSNIQRDHIPARQRKFSQMDEINRLSLARKEFISKYSDKPPEKANLKMFDFIYYNPTTNPIKQDKIKIDTQSSRHCSRASTPAPVPCLIEENSQEEISAPPVPQLKLGPNGELVLDEKSLIIETTAAQQARQQLASKDCIYLDEYSGNNGFYSRQKRTKDWNADETIKFYRCLHTVGTDFSLMLTLFPNRSRRDLKLKFKKEERHNGHLINKAILQPKAFDIEELKSEFKKEEEARLENEKKLKELEAEAKKKKRESSKAARAKYKSKADHALKNGDIAHTIGNTKVAPKKKKIKSRISKKNSTKKIDKILRRPTGYISSNRRINHKSSSSESEKQIIIKKDIEEENDNKCFENDMEKLCNDDNDVSPIHSVSYANDTNIEDVNESIQQSVKVKNQNNDILEITDISNIFSIDDIMPQLADIGTLALVTSRDNSRPSKKKYEIYILCKSTETLSKKPLDLPEETINCILIAIGKFQNSISDNEM